MRPSSLRVWAYAPLNVPSQRSPVLFLRSIAWLVFTPALGLVFSLLIDVDVCGEAGWVGRGPPTSLCLHVCDQEQQARMIKPVSSGPHCWVQGLQGAVTSL